MLMDGEMQSKFPGCGHVCIYTQVDVQHWYKGHATENTVPTDAPVNLAEW